MLKELDSIAGDLLGLHGYPVQPISWSAIFGTPRSQDPKRTVPARPQPAREAAVNRREKSIYGPSTPDMSMDETGRS